MTGTPPPLPAVTLICRRDLESGRKCLRSLQTCGRGLGELIIFDDGTLSPEEAGQLAADLGHCRVIRLAERDAMIDARLARHPRARAYRREHPLAFKLLDIPLFMQAEDYFFTDSDILFLRSFEVGSIAGAGRDQFVFMRDTREAYSARLPHLLWRHRLPLPSRVNSGFWWVPWARYDLDFIEWFLAVPEFHLFPPLVEQTCWAALTRGRGVRLAAESQIRCATDTMRITPETVAVHFNFHHKTRLVGFPSSDSGEAATGPGAELRLITPPRLGLGRMLLNSASEKWNARRG